MKTIYKEQTKNPSDMYSEIANFYYHDSWYWMVKEGDLIHDD